MLKGSPTRRNGVGRNSTFSSPSSASGSIKASFDIHTKQVYSCSMQGSLVVNGGKDADVRLQAGMSIISELHSDGSSRASLYVDPANGVHAFAADSGDTLLGCEFDEIEESVTLADFPDSVCIIKSTDAGSVLFAFKMDDDVVARRCAIHIALLCTACEVERKARLKMEKKQQKRRNSPRLRRKRAQQSAACHDSDQSLSPLSVSTSPRQRRGSDGSLKSSEPAPLQPAELNRTHSGNASLHSNDRSLHARDSSTELSRPTGQRQGELQAALVDLNNKSLEFLLAATSSRVHVVPASAKSLTKAVDRLLGMVPHDDETEAHELCQKIGSAAHKLPQTAKNAAEKVSLLELLSCSIRDVLELCRSVAHRYEQELQQRALRQLSASMLSLDEAVADVKLQSSSSAARSNIQKQYSVESQPDEDLSVDEPSPAAGQLSPKQRSRSFRKLSIDSGKLLNSIKSRAASFRRASAWSKSTTRNKKCASNGGTASGVSSASEDFGSDDSSLLGVASSPQSASAAEPLHAVPPRLMDIIEEEESSNSRQSSTRDSQVDFVEFLSGFDAKSGKARGQKDESAQDVDDAVESQPSVLNKEVQQDISDDSGDEHDQDDKPNEDHALQSDTDAEDEGSDDEPMSDGDDDPINTLDATMIDSQCTEKNGAASPATPETMLDGQSADCEQQDGIAEPVVLRRHKRKNSQFRASQITIDEMLALTPIKDRARRSSILTSSSGSSSSLTTAVVRRDSSATLEAVSDSVLAELLKDAELLVRRHVRAKDEEALSRIVKKSIANCNVQALNLVERPSSADGLLMDAFLLNYRWRVSPASLLRSLEKFASQQPNNALCFLEMTWHWVTHFWVDFDGDPKLVRRLKNFFNDPTLFSDELDWIKKEISLTVALQMERQHNTQALQSPTQESTGPTPGILLQLDAQTIAQQLTLFNYDIMAKVHPCEYALYNYHSEYLERRPSMAPVGENGLDGAEPLSSDAVDDSLHPNLDNAVQRFNEETTWVIAETETCKTKRDIAAIITKFIRVAQECVVLGNFFSLFTIMGAVESHQVRAHKKAWKIVPDKIKKLKADLEQLMDTSRNMKAYRDAYVEFDLKPRLPFLPLHMKDIYFIKETHKDNHEQPGAPFCQSDKEELMMLLRTIRGLSMHMQYRLQRDVALQSYFRVSVPGKGPTRQTGSSRKLASRQPSCTESIRSDAVESTAARSDSVIVTDASASGTATAAAKPMCDRKSSQMSDASDSSVSSWPSSTGLPDSADVPDVVGAAQDQEDTEAGLTAEHMAAPAAAAAFQPVSSPFRRSRSLRTSSSSPHRDSSPRTRRSGSFASFQMQQRATRSGSLSDFNSRRTSEWSEEEGGPRQPRLSIYSGPNTAPSFQQATYQRLMAQAGRPQSTPPERTAQSRLNSASSEDDHRFRSATPDRFGRGRSRGTLLKRAGTMDFATTGLARHSSDAGQSVPVQRFQRSSHELFYPDAVRPESARAEVGALASQGDDTAPEKEGRSTASPDDTLISPAEEVVFVDEPCTGAPQEEQAAEHPQCAVSDERCSTSTQAIGEATVFQDVDETSLRHTNSIGRDQLEGIGPVEKKDDNDDTDEEDDVPPLVQEGSLPNLSVATREKTRASLQAASAQEMVPQPLPVENQQQDQDDAFETSTVSETDVTLPTDIQDNWHSMSANSPPAVRQLNGSPSQSPSVRSITRVSRFAARSHNDSATTLV